MTLDARRVFLGSKKMGLEMLQAAVRSEPEATWHIIVPSDFEDSRSKFADFRNFARQSNFKLSVADSSSQVESLVEDAHPEVGLVCGWYTKLEIKSINLRRGLWGVHNSLLPDYRGGSPLVWAMINGEKVVGSSLFKLEEALDSGVIAGQVSTVVKDSDDIGTVSSRLEKKMSTLLEKEWINIVRGDKRSHRVQGRANVPAMKIRNDDDGLIDWNKGHKDILNFVRAQTHPYRGAFFWIEKKKIRVYSLRLGEELCKLSPGTITYSEDGKIEVTCGDGRRVIMEDSKIDKT